MALAFLDSLMISWGWGVEPPQDLGIYKRYDYESFKRCWYL